jgi:integrase
VSVRKRRWEVKKDGQPTGETKEAYVVDYVDQHGKRHIETFRLKKDADARHDQVRNDVRAGVHTTSTRTVGEAAADWIRFVDGEGRERATLDQYKGHVALHIAPRLGSQKLSNLTTPSINRFRDDLLANLSRATARKVLVSLKSILSDAQRRGHLSQNVALPVKISEAKRDQGRLKVGVDIPTPDEIRRILHSAPERWRPVLLTATFTGLRASELRGLRWQDVNFERGELHVHQRADRYLSIGRPKSSAGERVVPLGPIVVNTLREWKLRCAKNELDLVFPSPRGTIQRLEGIVRRGLIPAQVKAGVVDGNGQAKYTGLHALRHFYASWCINRKVDGGLELPAKMVQARLGHSSIVITLDRYGHLFPSGDDGAELAAAERALLA